MAAAARSNRRRTWALLAVSLGVLSLSAGAVGWGLATLFGGDIAAQLVGVAIASAITLVLCLFSLFKAMIQTEEAALASQGATRAPRSENEDLYALVARVAAAFGIEPPSIYIMIDNALNAFTVGRDPLHSSVAFSAGLLHTLTDPQLEAVTAHEISHIKNLDIRVTTFVAELTHTLYGVSAFCARIAAKVGAAFIIAWSDGWDWLAAGAQRRAAMSGGDRLWRMALTSCVLPLALAPWLLSWFLREVCWLTFHAVSREREYLADASAAARLGTGEHLADALQKIEEAGGVMSFANLAVAPLFIVAPLKEQGTLRNYFGATHPDPRDRIRRLRAWTAPQDTTHSPA